MNDPSFDAEPGIQYMNLTGESHVMEQRKAKKGDRKKEGEGEGEKKIES